jgi:DNA polymerase III subunit epsilon
LSALWRPCWPIMSLDFVAVDVETANAQRGSICSFGLSVVRNGKVVRTEDWLTRPPSQFDWFDGRNIGIHGISPGMVKQAPSFKDRLAQVLEIIGNLPIVAHNASFDTGAIRGGCDAEGLAWPDLTYGCTMILSRRILPNLGCHKLPVVCDELGIPPFDHHQAGADANAAALIALALARRQGAASLEDLASGVGVSLGRVHGRAWAGCVRA